MDEYLVVIIFLDSPHTVVDSNVKFSEDSNEIIVLRHSIN